jgi:hypothetical protein
MADWRAGFWGLKELKRVERLFIVPNMPIAGVFIALVATKSIVSLSLMRIINA